MAKEKCKHEDNITYLKLGQIEGKPCYVCQCEKCRQYFVIWLEEGANEDIKSGKKGYEELKKFLITK